MTITSKLKLQRQSVYYTYLIEELHAAYAQEWEEVTNAQQQQSALKKTMTV